jgi:hypothetical protein
MIPHRYQGNTIQDQFLSHIIIVPSIVNIRQINAQIILIVSITRIHR